MPAGLAYGSDVLFSASFRASSASTAAAISATREEACSEKSGAEEDDGANGYGCHYSSAYFLGLLISV